MRSNMALLKNLGAEVAQIRESIRQPNPVQTQYLASPVVHECALSPQFQYPSQSCRLPPGRRGDTAQYQQRFSPHILLWITHAWENILAASKVEVNIAPIVTDRSSHEHFPRRLQGERNQTRWSSKWKRVTPTGQGATSYSALSQQHCSHCGVPGRLRICASCKKDTVLKSVKLNISQNIENNTTCTLTHR